MRIIITHTDLDGVASAAILTRSLGDIDKFVFIQPHTLPKILSTIKCSDGCYVYICDLSPNSSSFQKLVNSLERLTSEGSEVWWFDHHIWDTAWIERVLDLGIKLRLDVSTCTAGVVYRYFGGGDPFSERIARAACSLDLWVFDDWLGNFLARYVGYSKSENWRRRVLDKLVGDTLIDEDVLRVVADSIDRELKILSEAIKKCGVKEICGLRAAYYYKSVKDHITSYVASLLMSRFGADIAIICRRGSVSLRSRGEVNVRDIAKALGGGGHHNAAGFSVSPPWIYRVFLLLGIRGPYIKWCISKIERVLCRERDNHGKYAPSLVRHSYWGQLEGRWPRSGC